MVMVNYDVSIVGVVVAAVAAFIVGFIWYGPLFGKKWMMYTGKKEADLQKGKDRMPMVMGLGFITALVTAYVLGVFISSLGAVAIVDALAVGFLAWLGFQATILAGDVLWDGRPVGLFVLNAAHQLVTALIMAAILVSL